MHTEPNLLTPTYPSKKRGIVWLISSLLVLCLAYGFAIFTLEVGLVSGVHGLSPNIYYILLLIAGIFSLAYLGLWYGMTLIVSAYKKYTFKKTRILTLVLAISLAFAGVCIYSYIQNTISRFESCKADDPITQAEWNDMMMDIGVDCKSFNPNDMIYKLLLQK